MDPADQRGGAGAGGEGPAPRAPFPSSPIGGSCGGHPARSPLPTTEPKMPADALFQPFTFKGLHLPNRIVMAPMTRSMSPGGVPTADVAGYYARRAAAQVGLIV